MGIEKLIVVLMVGFEPEAFGVVWIFWIDAISLGTKLLTLNIINAF